MMQRGKVSPEAKVGILVLAGIILLFFMSFRISRLERVKGEVYTALFPSASGLVINGAVEVAGVPVGKVEKIGLEKGKAKVWMRIGLVDMHEDAEAVIKTHGVLGDKYVEIKPGSPGLPLLPPGGTIARVTSAPDMDQMFASLESAARGLSEAGEFLQEVIGEEERKALKELVVNLKDASIDVKEIFRENKDKVGTLVANLEEISTKVRAGEGTLGKLITDDTLYANLKEISDKVRAGEGTLGKLLTDDTLYANLEGFSEELKPLAARANSTLADFQEISDRVKRGEGTVGKLLTDDALYSEAKEALASFRRVMVKVEKGEGLLGKVISDDELSKEAEKTMRQMRKAAEGVQEQTPITLLSVVLGLFL